MSHYLNEDNNLLNSDDVTLSKKGISQHRIVKKGGSWMFYIGKHKQNQNAGAIVELRFQDFDILQHWLIIFGLA